MPKDQWRNANERATYGPARPMEPRPEPIYAIICPKCEGPMCQRTGKREGRVFLGCLNYPHCSGTRPITAKPKKKRKREIVAEQLRQARILLSEAEHDLRQGAHPDAAWMERCRKWLSEK